jgi:hypothetical protein
VNVNFHDNIYNVLSRLEAEGIIQRGLLTTKPLSRREITRLILEAERNAEGKSLFINQLIKSTKERINIETAHTQLIKPIEDVYGDYAYTDSNISEKITYNNDGYTYDKGSNLISGFASVAEFKRVSLYFNPEIRLSENDTAIVANKIYGTFSFLGMDLQVGQDSQWWGPGYHGSLLLSNNAQPFTMVKLANSEPVLLPWVFRKLGLFKFTFFVTQLESERVIPEPYLWGLRINFKPSPYLDIGLARTALLGGEGRSSDFETWIKSFLGKGENESGSGAGDQRAGLDATLTMPFELQPVQLYAEAAGEDEAGGLPSKWAYLAGLYLPRILGLEEIDFRIEYANNHISGHPNVWYNHNIYKSGYTYKGHIIGHHMGTDSEDLFIQARYILPRKQDGNISISYDREKHNLSGRVNETEDQYTIKLHLPVNKSTFFNAEYSFGRIKNLDNMEGDDRNINIVSAKIRYRF